MKPTTLLVGFDSAWTAHNSGALVGLLCFDEGTSCELGPPQVANYEQAEEIISAWQATWRPKVTLILLDQPTIVTNPDGQRPVENIVSSPVSRRRGGMQPASKSRKEMFGHGAPVWHFLELFGGAGDPLRPISEKCVFETYPVLAIIALGWLLQDARPKGRLPKYNPRRNFSRSDWEHLCEKASGEFQVRGLHQIETWINDIAKKARPNKSDQDCLDACLCLLVALYLVELKDCLIVGDQQHGYIVVPFSDTLREELDNRCRNIGLSPSEFVRKFKLDCRPPETGTESALRTILREMHEALPLESMAPASKIKSLRCPTCQTIVLQSDEDFPFCSDRCRRIDLGKWASGVYKISSPILDPDVLEGLDESMSQTRNQSRTQSRNDHGTHSSNEDDY